MKAVRRKIAATPNSREFFCPWCGCIGGFAGKPGQYDCPQCEAPSFFEWDGQSFRVHAVPEYRQKILPSEKADIVNKL